MSANNNKPASANLPDKGNLKGATPVLNTQDQARTYIRADSERWKDVIEKNNIKAE